MLRVFPPSYSTWKRSSWKKEEKSICTEDIYIQSQIHQGVGQNSNVSWESLIVYLLVYFNLTKIAPIKLVHVMLLIDSPVFLRYWPTPYLFIVSRAVI